TAAGRRAHSRGDHGAAVSLLERAADLVPAAELDLALETELVDAMFYAGKTGDALARAVSIAERASAAGDLVGELSGRIAEGKIRLFREPEGAAEKLATLIERALPV